MGVFYLAPILLAAGFHSRVQTLIAVGLATGTWLLVDLLGGPPYQHALAPYWNALARMLTFGMIGLLFYQIRHLREREKRLMQFVVHDLRNPLTALDLSIQRLAGEIPDAGPIGICQHLVGRLRGLVDSLLDLSRLEEARLEVRLEPFEVARLIETVLKRFQVVLTHFGITACFEPTEGPWVALGDPRLVERVLENVIGNAVKFSPKGGAIELGLVRGPSKTLRIRVSDQGPGIPLALRETVFEPYMSLDAHQGKDGAGIGLGLAFCRGALEAQGGKIWIDESNRTGTCVVIELPFGSDSPA